MGQSGQNFFHNAAAHRFCATVIRCHAMYALGVLVRYSAEACGNAGVERLIRLFVTVCWRAPHSQALPRDLPGCLKQKCHVRRKTKLGLQNVNQPHNSGVCLRAPIALIGHGRIRKTIAQHNPPLRQSRTNDLIYMVEPGCKMRQNFRTEGKRSLPEQQQFAQCLRTGGPSGFTRGQHLVSVGLQTIPEQAELR